MTTEPAASAASAVDTRHAKTDLYDTVRKTFFIQYPVWFITALALAGVLVFGLTGFLGYTDPAIRQPIDDAFRQPWLLYLWMSALLITLIASILRDTSLRKRLIAMLVVAVIAIVFIGVTKFNDILPDIIRRLLGQHVIFQYLSQQPATYNVVNFGIIAIFWADTIRRWGRHKRGLPLDPRADIGLDEHGAPRRDPASVPTMSELVSGDFMAGAVLTLLLAGLFHRDFLGQFIRPVGGLTWCHVSWALGACPRGATLVDPPTLTFMDVIQTLLYLVIALTVLALTAMVSGLGAVGGVDDRSLALAATATEDESSTLPIALDVTQTLLKTLKAAIDRRLRLLASNFLLSLRVVGWPVLLFVGTYGIADLCVNLEGYLHSAKSGHDVLAYIAPAAGWAALALVCAVGSVALMLFRVRVVTNTSLFLGLIGFILLLVFWIFSLALWGANLFVNQVSGSTARNPFPPSWLTFISMAALALFGLRLAFRWLRQQGQQARVAVRANAAAASAGAAAASGTGAEREPAAVATNRPSGTSSH